MNCLIDTCTFNKQLEYYHVSSEQIFPAVKSVELTCGLGKVSCLQIL